MTFYARMKVQGIRVSRFAKNEPAGCPLDCLRGRIMKGFKMFRSLPGGSKWRIVKRYALFQIPDLAVLSCVLIVIQRWIELPPWLPLVLLSTWVAKDVALFPFLWPAYDTEARGDIRPFVGDEGIAEQRLVPSGFIRVHGELWQARVTREDMCIEKGERVRVLGGDGLILLVEPVKRKSDKMIDRAGRSPSSEKWDR